MTGWSSIPPERDPWREAAREVVISCGAALYNLRLAIAVAGRSPSVWLLPGPDRESGLPTTVTAERTLLASVEVMPARAAPPAGAKQELYEALTQSLELADADGRLRSWPWRTSYTEIPPVVIRVGYAPVERTAAHASGAADAASRLSVTA